MTENNAVAIREDMSVATKTALPIQSMADVFDLGSYIAKSGMFGAGSDSKGIVIASACLQEGMSLLEFKRTFHVTNTGEVTMRADMMLAEFIRRGGKCKWIEYSDTIAKAIFSYRENENVTIQYTIEEAEKAGYIRPGSNWTKDPGSQLRARLITRAVRMLCPGAVAGIYTPEEMADLHEPQETKAAEKPARLAPDDPRCVKAELVDAAPATPEPTPFKTPTPDPAPAPKKAKAAPASQPTPPAAPAPGPSQDPEYYATCPMPGKMFGIKWRDMSMEHLEYAKNITHPDMEPEHYTAVAEAIATFGMPF